MLTIKWMLPSVSLNHSGAHVSFTPVTCAGTSVRKVQVLRSGLEAMAKLAEVVDEVETALADSQDREVSTTAIGELLMNRLRTLDKIAYVRFASVYRDFQDVEAFLTELKDLLQRRG